MSSSGRLTAEAYLAAIVDSSDAVIFTTDRTGAITSWNPAAERLLGYTSAEAIGLDMSALVSPSAAHENSERLASALSGETVSDSETILIRKDGVPLEVSRITSPIRDADAAILGAVTIARDIADRKRLEVAPLRLAAIVQSSDDVIVSKDLNGIVMSWNDAAERLFGFTAEEMIGQSITKIIPTARLFEEDYVLGRIRAGLKVDHFETVRQAKDGRLIDISLTVSPIRDRTGRIIGASKIARDITEQRRLLEAQRAATAREEAARRQILEIENRRVREASRLKGEFVANMSHELRTPLNSIIGFAELMVDERFGPIGERYREFAGTMLMSAQHLRQLIDDILDLAKVESGRIDLQPQPTDLRTVVDEVVSIVAGVARPRKLRLEVDVDPALDIVNIDPSRFKQVLYNYLSNAIKFSPEGGRVVVRLRMEGAGRFRLEVQDWGVGIKAEDLHKLFIEFQQLDASTAKMHPGTGLGLALTKRIVEAQGGSVGVDTEFGVGTTFFASLPTTATATVATVTREVADVPRPV